MMASREKYQEEFDLERVTELFDEALTSNDERVVNALRSLLMIVTLTRPESAEQSIRQGRGPIRNLTDRLRQLENEVRTLKTRVDYTATNSQREMARTATGTAHPWHGTGGYGGPFTYGTAISGATMADPAAGCAVGVSPIPALTTADINDMIKKINGSMTPPKSSTRIDSEDC